MSGKALSLTLLAFAKLRAGQCQIVLTTATFSALLSNTDSNIRIADQLAANGYFTVIPDIWEGDNVSLTIP